MAGIESLVSGIAGALGGGGGLGGILKGTGGAGGHDPSNLLSGLLGGGDGGGAGSGLGGILGKLGEMAMGFFSSLMGAMKGGGDGAPLGDAKLGAQALSGSPAMSKVSLGLATDAGLPPAPAPGAGNAIQTSAGKAFPVEGGNVIGHPNEGTHTLGNWQSDNALDIAAPEGTPIYAPSDGVVTKAQGSNDDPSSRFNGFNFELEGADNAWFMQHMSEMTVKDGDHVKQGQMIGRVGSANNNSHLHIGQRDGNPDETFRV